MRESFHNVKATRQFSDDTLACDGDPNLSRALRIILVIGISFLERILSMGPVQHPHPLLYLEELRKTVLEAILDFLYHSQTKVPQMELVTFLQTARRLEVMGLQSEEEYIHKQNTDVGLEGVGAKDPIEGPMFVNGSVGNKKGFEK